MDNTGFGPLRPVSGVDNIQRITSKGPIDPRPIATVAGRIAGLGLTTDRDSLKLMLDRLDDTIVAVSSAPGHGAIGIVRLSGPRAVDIADRMTTADDLVPLSARLGSTRTRGEVEIEPNLGLPADLYLFRAPHSYTRQDMVEMHTVGAPAALELVRKRAISLGAVAAEPGEFTARAFVSGAKDLASAEAVAGLIRAKTDTQLRASRRMMDGSLNRDVRTVRDALAELLALVEADIDFAEEPIDFITPPELGKRLEEISESLQPLLAEPATIERLDVLPRILLFGPPNAGKSTLMNRLSGTSRAICAAAAGTTRDVLSAPIELENGEAILLDTAGVDRSEDQIIAQARELTLSQAERVDLLCVVLDITAADNEHLLSVIRSLDVSKIVVAANKSDLLTPEAVGPAAAVIEPWELGPVCAISAITGEGIAELSEHLRQALGSGDGTTAAEGVILSERQHAAIRLASEALARSADLARGASETIDCADVLAFELREALDALGAVTGDVTTEDLLGQVFANFCIGK